MAPHSSTLAWKIQWMEEAGRPQSMGSLSRTWLSNFTFTFHFHALEKETATHSSVLAWRIPGMGEPGGLPSMGSHRVGHDWSDLAAIAAVCVCMLQLMFFRVVLDSQQNWGKGMQISHIFYFSCFSVFNIFFLFHFWSTWFRIFREYLP